MTYRRNYVMGGLGAGQPSDETYVPGFSLTHLLTSGVGLIVGGAALGYFLTKGSHKMRNAALGAAAAFGVSYMMKRPVVAIPDDQLPEMEEQF